MVSGLPVMVWCLLLGLGSTWLSCLGGLVLALPVLLVIVGVIVAFLLAESIDVGWLGTSLDRAGTLVCLVWLILFEGVFFFGAVWS